MDFKVGLTDAAQDDLGAVVDFIARKNPQAAARIGNEILAATLSLSSFPHRGSPVRLRSGIRKLSYRYYLIFYRVDESARWVEVLRIWDGRQHPGLLKV